MGKHMYCLDMDNGRPHSIIKIGMKQVGINILSALRETDNLELTLLYYEC